MRENKSFFIQVWAVKCCHILTNKSNVTICTKSGAKNRSVFLFDIFCPILHLNVTFYAHLKG